MAERSIRVLLWLRGFFKVLPDHLIRIMNGAISFLVLFMIFALIAFAGAKAIAIYQGFANYASGNVLHDTALLIVIVKAYKVLLYYYKRHRVSIKYIVEISVIAPAIELIFAAGEQSLWISVLFGVFGIANLIIYILFYEKLSKIDEKECLSNTDLDPRSSPQNK
jgi:uncharacterized membrane protein (DUF373 family)